MSTKPDQPSVYHDGPCHTECEHVHDLIRQIASDLFEPRLVVGVTRAGVMKYASSLPIDRTVEALRDLANVIERTGRRQYEAAMN